MHRVFVPPEFLPEIRGADVHYLRDVLRLKVGDKLELFDGSGKIYQAKISTISQESITCTIVSTSVAAEPVPKLTLAQAITKASKMDFVIEKCTELGVNQIIPMLTERTIPQSAKLERWQKIAKEAAEQSGRVTIPNILPLAKFEGILKMRNKFNLAIIAYEQEKNVTLKKHFSDNPVTGYPDILIAIGPEGGFSEAEVETARDAGFISVSLGKRILRTETAGLAVLSAIAYELGS